MPYEPGKAVPPKLPQARAFWYQWLLCTRPGEAEFRADPTAFGRAQWDAWSPRGWYTEAEFAAAARSWKGTDFQDVVLHGYRSRWGHADFDPRYAGLQTRFEAAKSLTVPTLLLHGKEDGCELAETTEGAERHFKAAYQRVLLDGTGHFPQRESPDAVAAALLAHLRRPAYVNG